jgi:hypothetical protein
VSKLTGRFRYCAFGRDSTEAEPAVAVSVVAVPAPALRFCGAADADCAADRPASGFAGVAPGLAGAACGAADCAGGDDGAAAG